MDNSGSSVDESIGEVVLSVKGMMLLCGNSVECKDRVREKISAMQDDEMNSFIELFQKPRKNIVPQLVMAAGEIVLASILFFIGIGILSPALEGFTGPALLLNYFVSTQMYLVDALPYFSIVLLVDFLLAIVLLSASFYAIKESADRITDTGLRYR